MKPRCTCFRVRVGSITVSRYRNTRRLTLDIEFGIIDETAWKPTWKSGKTLQEQSGKAIRLEVDRTLMQGRAASITAVKPSGNLAITWGEIKL